MLVSDLLVRVRDVTGDTDGSRWNDARLIREVNSAQKVLCKDTLLLRESINIVVHSNQAQYQVNNCFKISRVLYNSKALKQEIDFNLDSKGMWETDTGTPTTLVVNHLNRAIVKLYPIPVFEEPVIFDLTEANILSINYSKVPEPIALVADELEVPELYMETLVYYITAQLFRSDLDAQNRQFGVEQLQLYATDVNEITSTVARSFSSGGHTTAYRGIQ